MWDIPNGKRATESSEISQAALLRACDETIIYYSIERSIMISLVEGTGVRRRTIIGWLDNVTTCTCLSGAIVY